MEELRRKRAALEGGVTALNERPAPQRSPPAPETAPWAHVNPLREPNLVPLTPASLAPVFGNSALVVTRELEWGTLVLGFEQANRYTIRNADGAVVAYLAEETTTLASAVSRQLLRRRRPFVATLLNPAGDVIFRVRRPIYLINSNTVVEDAFGAVVGEIKAVWHLYRRQYDLFLHKQQFGSVRSGLLAWEFEVMDEGGQPLARVDRNFTGFARELFTDYGCYAVHFGAALENADPGLTREAQDDQSSVPPSGGNAVVPSSTDVWQPSAYARPLQLTERAACLALAIAADFDYFTHNSRGHGILGGGLAMPFPFPMPSGEASSTESDAGASAAAGAAAASAGDSTDENDESPLWRRDEESPQPSEPLPDRGDWRARESLGGDEPFKADEEKPTWTDKWFNQPDEEDDGDDDGDGGDGDEDGGGGGFGALGRVLGTIWDSNRQE